VLSAAERQVLLFNMRRRPIFRGRKACHIEKEMAFEDMEVIES